MIRILRIELLRSTAPWAATGLAAFGIFVLFASNGPYRSWMELAIVQRDIMQLTWPLALAAGAWQGIRERRSHAEKLLGTTPRPRHRRVLPVAVAMAVAAAVADVVTFAAGAGHLRHPGAYFSVGAIALIAVGALAMVAAVWVAQALGALLPSPLTPPIVAVVGVVAVSLLPALISDQDHRPGVVLLFPALQGPRDHGFAVQMLSTQVVALQVAWLAAVAAAGLALFAAGGTRARLAALLPVALGAAIVAPALPDRLSDAWVEDPTATAVVCSAGDPQVCISRAHAYALAYVVGPAHEALSVMATKLALTANRVVVRDADSRLAPDPQPADEILTSIPIFDDLMTDYTPDNLLHSMLAGAGTRPCGNQAGYDPAKYGESQPNIRYPAAREVAAEWLLDTTPRPASKPDDDPASALVTQTLAALHALPLTEQRDRIAALRAAELTCVAGDRLDLLTGGGSR